MEVSNTLHRLKSLQKLCSHDNTNYPQGILIIPGQDGRNNKVSIQLLKYLFIDSIGKDLLDATLDQEYESLEDIVLFIQDTSVSVIWTNEIKSLIGSKLLKYPFLIEYITSRKEEEEIDLQQARKYCDFKRMMLESLPSGKNVGVSIPMGYDSVQDIEGWPILQSFALDSLYCSTGFFTAKYNTLDISEYVDILFKTVDGSCLNHAISTVRRSILPHVEQSILQLDALTSNQRSKVSAEDAIGPLDILFEFSSMDCTITPDPMLKPIMYFGPETKHIGSIQKRWQEKTADNHLHAVAEACEPTSGIRWCRTYFLQRGKCVDYFKDTDTLVNDDDDNDTSNNDGAVTEVSADGDDSTSIIGMGKATSIIDHLERLYVKLWMSLRMTVRYAFSRNKDILEAATAIQEVLDDLMKGKKSYPEMHINNIPSLSLSKIVLKGNEVLQVHIDCMDGLGRIATIEDIDDMGGTCWVYIRVTVSGVDVGNDNYGSIAVGDTFLFAPIDKAQSTQSTHLSSYDNGDLNDVNIPLLSDPYCVTHPIPYYRSLIGRGREEMSSNRLLKCTRSMHMLKRLGLDRLLETTSGSGLLSLPIITDHPIMPYATAEVRTYASGFVIEKINSLSCLPIVVSIGTHVEQMWTMDASDCMEQAMAMLPNSKYPLSSCDGLIVVFKLKSFTKPSGVSVAMMSDTYSKSIDTNYINYNGLARSLSSCCDVEPQHIAFFIPTRSRYSAAMSAARVEWRTALRVHDVVEKKGSSHKIPDSVLRGLLVAVDTWTSTADANSVFDESAIVTAKDVISIAEMSRMYTPAFPIYPGTAYITMKCMHTLSESQRLKYGYVFPSADEVVINSEPLTQLVFAVGHAGSGVMHIGSQLKGRLTSALSSAYTVSELYIDLVAAAGYCETSSSSSSSSKLSFLHDIVSDKIRDFKKSKMSVDVIVITLVTVPKYYNKLCDIIGLLSSKMTAHVSSVLSILSSSAMQFGVHTNDGYASQPFSESSYGVGMEVYRSATLDMCQDGVTDICIVLEEKASAVGYSVFKSWLSNVNPSAVAFRASPANMRLDEYVIELLQERIEVYNEDVHNGDIIASKLPLADRHAFVLRNGLYGVPFLSFDHGIVCRRSACSMIIDKGLSIHRCIGATTATTTTATTTTCNDNNRRVVWDVSNLVRLLQLLFPSAIANTIFDDTWNVPHNIDNSVGLKRCITLAKVKVLTSKQYSDSRERYRCGIKAMKAQKSKELLSLTSGIASCHGIIKLRAGKLKLSETVASNATSKAAVGTATSSSMALVEVCSGCILIRQISEVTAKNILANSPSMMTNDLIFEGSFSHIDCSLLNELLSYCELGTIQRKRRMNRDSLTHADLLEIQKEHKSSKLSDGWWYDGSLYIDINGTRRQLRPDIEQIALAYLAKEDKKVKEYNELCDLVESVMSY